MWFYVFLLVSALLLAVWVSRTNLFRHWRGHNTDPGQQGTRRVIGDFRRDPDLDRRRGDTG